MDFTFEFGETAEATAFFNRHSHVEPALDRMQVVINKCFSRPVPTPKSEYILFSLGESCREDFLEIMFLAVNGYGVGASKLLRGLYERAVALAYMVKEPSKVERFIRFAAVQEKKALNDALKVVTEQDWDETMAPDNTAAEIRSRFDTVKGEFEHTDCRKCNTKRSAISWDVDFASMVRRVGEPYTAYYLGAYTKPNLELHATLTSALREDDKNQATRADRRRAEADLAFFFASLLLMEVIHSQNSFFSLNLDEEIAVAQHSIVIAWNKWTAE